jgi:hypothetical protein
MRTLRHYLILYDAECPMCQLYTRAFTKSGMLEPGGRAPYQTVLDPESGQLPATCPLIDRQRAVNEIALIDTSTGEVRYGIESMFKVIGHSFPLFRPLFNNSAFTWLMRKTYTFISLNRKVIIPPASPAVALAKEWSPAKPSLPIPQPTFRLKYRLAYLAFCTVIAAAILTRYAHLLTGIIPKGNAAREYLICSGQILFQGVAVSIIAPNKRWDYLGNMMTISLAGALVLLPAIALTTFTHLPPVAATGWFLLVAALMLVEHIRRTKLLGLDWTLTITWITYRVLVLFTIINNSATAF